MHRASLGAALAALFFCTNALAQQPLCIPGTPWCLPNAASGQVGGGANGQVGPNGANGSAHGNGNGQVQQPAPPPTYRPQPPPPPTYTPPPPPAPTVQPPPPLPAPQAPAPQPTYYNPPSGPRAPQSPGIGIYPVVRVGKDSGFHVGGAFSFGFHLPYWGLELDTMFLRGGTVTTTDISFVPSFVTRFGADTDAATYDGFYARLGPEFRFSFADGRSMANGQMFHIGVQIGAGYEHPISSFVSWRVLDVRLFGAWRTDSLDIPDDELGHKSEYGLLFATGITFY